MRTHLQRELNSLDHQVLLLASRVGENLHAALNLALETLDDESLSMERRDGVVASLQACDLEIDQLEVKLEEECLKVLALYQPVAVDLRHVASLLKLNNDLERIGDHAVSIAQCARWVSPGDWGDLKNMLDETSAVYQKMAEILRDSDTRRIQDILENDDRLDDLKHEIRRNIRHRVGKRPESVASDLAGFEMAHHLERVADLCTNICEDVYYATTGTIIRHGGMSTS